MLIANPIYDSVFKHLIEDAEIARGMVSRLLGRKVLELKPRPQEISSLRGPAPATLSGDSPPVRIYRVDFSALVEMADGSRQNVLVELQKSQTAGDIERFRRYLGLNYARREDKGDPPRPLAPIYLLGFVLNQGLPKVVRVVRNYVNGVTGEIVSSEPDTFLEALSHNTIMVQLGKDENLGDTELGRMLELFDQGKIIGRSRHFLDMDAGDIPANDPLVRAMARKLSAAAADAETLELMEVEDEIAESLREATEERRLKEQAIMDRRKAEKATKEARRKEKEARRKTEEARSKEKEARSKEKEARSKEKEAQRKTEEARQKTEEALTHAAEERQQKEAALQEAERLRARLRELGVELPD